MDLGEDIQLSETAFTTSILRSQNEKLSRDSYAYLWREPRSEQWAQKFLEQVSTEEASSHALRNRYFLDQIERLWKAGKIDCLLNFGSGFSMYPFLLPQGLTHIEIDLPKIIRVKESKIREWTQNGILDACTIRFLGMDFNQYDSSELKERLLPEVKGKRVFILIEGVLFFLNQTKTEELFDVFNNLQGPGDYIGSVSFLPETTSTKAFKRLKYFLENELTDNDDFENQTIPKEFYDSLENYELKDWQDYFSLAEKYANPVDNKPDDILNENYYLLQKK